MTRNETALRWFYLFITPSYETTGYDITLTLDRQADAGVDGDAPEGTSVSWDVPASGGVAGRLGDLDLKDAYVLTIEGGDVIEFTLSSPSGHPVEVQVTLGGVSELTLSTDDGASVTDKIVTAYETTGGEMYVVVRHRINLPAGIVATYELEIDVEMQDDCGTGQDAPATYDDAIPVSSGSHTGILAGKDKADVYTVLMSARVPLSIYLTGVDGSTLEVSVRSGIDV